MSASRHRATPSPLREAQEYSPGPGGRRPPTRTPPSTRRSRRHQNTACSSSWSPPSRLVSRASGCSTGCAPRSLKRRGVMASTAYHEGTKPHEEHETLLYKIILRDLRGFSCLRDEWISHAPLRTFCLLLAVVQNDLQARAAVCVQHANRRL